MRVFPKKLMVSATAALGALAVLTGCGGTSTGGSTSNASASSSRSTAPSGCTPSATAKKYPAVAGKSLVVAVAPQDPPYVFQDPNNPSHIVGFDADMVAAISQCLGVHYRWANVSFDGLLPTVQSGRADMLDSGIYATPERAKVLPFVLYMKASTGAMVRAGNPDHVSSITDLCGKNVAELIGSVEAAIAKSETPKCKSAGKSSIHLTLYKDDNSAINAVRTGRSVAFMADAGFVSTTVKQLKGQLQPAFHILSGYILGIGINKGKPQLVQAIHDAVGTLQSDGTEKRLLAKWGFPTTLANPPTIVGG